MSTVTSAIATAAAFIFSMEVNKKVTKTNGDGEYQLVGKVEVPVFSLDAFGLPAIPNSKDADGLPTYDDPKLQYVQDAVTAAIKAAARNKLVSGSITLKAGNKIAATVEELLESGQNSGAALALYRDFINAFTTYLATKSGKSAAVQALYTSMIKAKQSITLSAPARKQGLLRQLTEFFNSLSEEDGAKFASVLDGLVTLCEQVVDLSDTEL